MTDAVTPEHDYEAHLTCRMMPNQIEGVYRGQGFYFRARHGEWQLHRRAGEVIDWQSPIATGEDERAGWWDADEVLPLCERLVRAHMARLDGA